MSLQHFKVKVEFEDDGTGQPAFESRVVCVSKNDAIRTVADAVAHCTYVVGQFKGKYVTRIHHKDECGNFFSIIKCDPVRQEPFADVGGTPEIASLTAKPDIAK